MIQYHTQYLFTNCKDFSFWNWSLSIHIVRSHINPIGSRSKHTQYKDSDICCHIEPHHPSIGLISDCDLWTIITVPYNISCKYMYTTALGMGNYSIITIIVIILLTIIDIVYFSLTGDNRNRQLCVTIMMITDNFF